MRLVTSLPACPCKFGAIMVQGISENNSHLLGKNNAPALGKYVVALHLRQFRRTNRKAHHVSNTERESESDHGKDHESKCEVCQTSHEASI